MGFDVSALSAACLEAAENCSDAAIEIAEKIDDKIIDGEQGTSADQSNLDRITRRGIALENVVETAIQEEGKVQDNMLRS